MNEMSTRATRPNRLMGVEITPISSEIAMLDLAPEYGDPAGLVINRDIAEYLIRELQVFLEPSLRKTS